MLEEALAKLAEKLKAYGVQADAPGVEALLNRLVALLEQQPSLVEDPFFGALLPRLAADLRSGNDATLTRLELLAGAPPILLERRPLTETLKALLGRGS